MAVCLWFLSASAATASTWRVWVFWATPGASAMLSISLQAERPLASGVAIVDAGDWPYVTLPEAGTVINGYGGVCHVGADGIITATLQRTDPGASQHLYCQIHVQISPDAPSTTFPIGFESVACVDGNAAPVACDALPGTLFIDGPPTVADRSLLLLPHAAPRGPSREAIDGFDPTDAGSMPPLRTLSSPRPIRMQVRYRGPDLEDDVRIANPAALAMMNAMYVTYASIADRDRALRFAETDRAVAAVFPHGGLPSVYLHPARPRAGEPLALYLETGICESYRTDDPDDREVEVSGNEVRVYLPTDNDNMCGVPPPGVIPHILNLPSLAAGNYVLRVLHRPYYPDEVVDNRYTLAFTVAPGQTAIAGPRQIPGPTAGWLIMLVLVMCIAGWARSGKV